MHKNRCNNKCGKVDMITIWEIPNEEEYSKQLILGSRFKIADLV